MGTSRRRCRGSTLAIVLWVACLLMGVSASMLSTSLYRAAHARSATELALADEGAESAASLALYELATGADVNGDAIGECAGTLDGAAFAATLAPAFGGEGTYTITATATAGGRTRAVEVVVRLGPERFEHALFGLESVTTGGSTVIDSYDSSAGSYLSQVGLDGHAGDDGDIGSNGTINIGGGTVHGDAIPGPGESVTGKTESVTGSTSPSSTTTAVPDYVYAPEIKASGAFNAKVPVIVKPGDYRYTKFTANAGGIVTVTGATRLWIDGDFSISGSAMIVLSPGATLEIHHGSGSFSLGGGGIVNANQAPADLSILSATTDKLTLAGGAEFHGLVYAPYADVTSTGNSGFYGALVGRTVAFKGGTAVHFDSSLRVPNSEDEIEVLVMRPIAAP